MSNNDDPGFLAGVWTSNVLWGITIMIILANALPSCQSTVVAHHAGHYVLDPKTGNSTFHWNDEAPESAEKAKP